MSGHEAQPRVVGESPWVNRALGALAWLVALLFFFPVFWMVLNSFKEEQDANTSPKLFFDAHPRPLPRGDRERRRPAVLRRGLHQLGRDRAHLDA